MSLIPLPPEQTAAACSNCGAPLVADQRYCLSCGQPVSPVRLAFLDVLQSDQAPAQGRGWGAPPIDTGPAGYLPVEYGRGPEGWLRRHSGLLGLLSVLAMCLLAGLLVGHWATQKSPTLPSKQVIKIEGLSAAPTTGTTTTPTTTPSESSGEEVTGGKTSGSQEKKEAAEGEKESAAEKAPPAAPKKVETKKLEKISKTSGKKHEEEVNALGAEPIET